MTDGQLEVAVNLFKSRELAQKFVDAVERFASEGEVDNFANYVVSLPYHDGKCTIPAPIVPELVEWLKQKADDYLTKTQQDFAKYLRK